jgi:hypothetical protein
MELILDNLRLLNKHVHHDINLLPDLVGFLLEQLEEVIACHELVLQLTDLLVHRRGDVVDALTAAGFHAVLRVVHLVDVWSTDIT